MHPTYQGVAEIIRGWISAGRYQPGDRLPSHKVIADELETTRQTVVAAVRLLTQEGVVQTGGSRGTWVRERITFWTDATAYDDPDSPRPTGGDAFVSAVRETGRTPETQFEMRIEPAAADIAHHLGIASNELVCLRSVGQLVDQHPWSRATSYYPMDITQACGLDDPHDIPEGTVRRMASRGYRESGSVDEVTTRPPSGDETRDLGVPAGTAMLVWTRIAASDHRITRVTRSILPGDRNALTFRQGSTEAVNTIFAARATPKEGS